MTENQTEEMTAKAVFDLIKAPQSYIDAVYDFYVVFGRFEASVMHLYYADCVDKSGPPKINHDRLANKLEPACEQKLSAISGSSIFKKPPKKQIQKDGGISWADYAPTSNHSLTRHAVRHIFTVRNNLFHGSKHLKREGDNKRDETLIRDSLKIIKLILEQDAELTKYYREFL